MANELMVIAPYLYQGMWVFDDPSVGLEKEPFVLGIPEMIDGLVKEIPNAENSFRLIFSARPFPEHQMELTWLREELGGNWYRQQDPLIEGWLCPALLRYFEKAPDTIYLKAEAMERSGSS